MQRLTSIILYLFAIACFVFASQTVFANIVKFGVQAPRGNASAMKKWSEFGSYLGAELGTKVQIVPLNPSKTVAAVNKGKVDFMLSNPALAVVLEQKHKSEVLATMNKKSGSQFSGVIISRKGSGIKKAADLKGKRVLAFKFKKSAAAYVFQVKYLKDQGIDVNTDFAEFREAKKQDDIVMGVKVGAVDAGFIKTGLLEAMAREGKVKLDDFIIVDSKQDDGLKLLHSTYLYPSWTVTARASIDNAIKQKVRTALLKMTKDMPASKKAKIVGFVEPRSLESLTETLKDLKMPPFEK